MQTWLRVLWLLVIVTGFDTPLAQAQSYPTKPITMIVPLPPGGAIDVLARVLADEMGKVLGQSVVIENVSGAGSSIGVARASRAVPDGYTLGFGNWANYVVAGLVYPVQYDALRDFEPVAEVSDTPFWIVARAGIPAKDMSELLAWLKANPGKATAGTVGAGSGSHVCALYLQKETQTDFQTVPYRGGAPALQDLVAGRIDFMCDLAANTLPMVRAGQIRPYAIMAPKSWFAAPEVPTIEETGLPPLYLSAWTGIWAPAGTAKDVVAKLAAAARQALASPAVRARYETLGQEVPPLERQNPEGFAAFHRAEMAKWAPIIKAAGIKVE